MSAAEPLRVIVDKGPNRLTFLRSTRSEFGDELRKGGADALRGSEIDIRTFRAEGSTYSEGAAWRALFCVQIGRTYFAADGLDDESHATLIHGALSFLAAEQRAREDSFAPGRAQ